jgi:serine/threonine protein kinase
MVQAAELLDALHRLRLLTPEQLDQLGRDPKARAAVPRALAADLLGKGWLTAFQVNRLLQGRGQELVLGPYVLLERRGEGRLGPAYKARHQKLGHVAALTVLRPERLRDPDALRRFHAEVRAAAQLDHPNIARVYGADEAGGIPFLAVELVEGTDLARHVKERGPLPVERACDYVRQAALGLAHAHRRGLVHRDIKPHNLLLTADGATVKVLDFGLASLTHVEVDENSGTMTQEGAVVGTADYVAPEQALSARGADIRADLYSLGCTLYYLLTGRPPFPGGTLMEKLVRHREHLPVPVESLRLGLPPAVAAVVHRLLAKDPAARYQTPAELATALAGILERPHVAPAVDGTWSAVAAGPPTRRDPATAGAANSLPRGAPTGKPVPSRRPAGAGGCWVVAAGGILAAALLAGGLFWWLGPGLDAPVTDDAPPMHPPAAKAAPPVFARPEDEAWARSVAAMPAEEQVAAVAAKLKERNPGFDGAVTPAITGGFVTRLEFLADEVTDLSPVRALPRLRELRCAGSDAGRGKLADLAPLRGMPLKALEVTDTKVADLAPLRGMPLISLTCERTAVKDLSPLQGLGLIRLSIDGTAVANLSPLRGMPLIQLSCSGTAVADLSPLTGMRLISLSCNHTKVTDLAPLRGMPLVTIACAVPSGRDVEVLRSIPTLQTINGQPASEFWEQTESPAK